MVLDRFSPPVREWFTTTFRDPTPAQAEGWPAISSGEHTLILAPTGSGKTLAAFLWAIDRLTAEPVPGRERRTRVLYLSPLRALAVDVDRNLRAPLRGITLAAERLGVDVASPTVAMRTGDTPADERRRMLRDPADILITTPESLFLLLTSRARETLAGVRWVIVDEIHAIAGTKRGAHLALSLERLAEVADGGFQRIGLSATQRPLDEIAGFLGGNDDEGKPRPVTVVDAGVRKELDVEVIVPVEDMGELGSIVDEQVSGPVAAAAPRRSIWPAIHPRLLDLILEHRSTLIFCNARRLAERLAARLNELWREQHGIDESAPDLVKAHHGSLSREQRVLIEDELKRGALRALVATSSLELGIDMGAIDLVVQVESPGSVSRGLQRIGRAGHQVGEPSRGKLFPKYRGDLVEAAVVVQRMRDGLIEETRYPRNPLDVLAQQIVAVAAMDDWDVDALARLVRRAANFSELTDGAFESVLDLLSGRYPSEEFAELRPRIVWDRITGVVRGRDAAQRLAVTNPGTIPDRGLFGVFLPDGARVGELDEEMVYESRTGETFTLGASTWRIEEITRDRVIVTPAPGEPGKMPFWHGDKPGRPLELGRAIGAFLRDPPDEAALVERAGLDALAARNLLAYIEEQRGSTGSVPDDRTIVVERFRDEIGDWRICVLSPFGAAIHAPWALAIEERLSERHGLEVQTIWSDDGIVLRLPEAVDRIPLEELTIDPEEVEELVVRHLPASPLFASRFREASARALLLPRRRPGHRTPLWQQRQRAGDLLEVAAKYPAFPILLETTRECLRDVFDVPGLREVLGDLRSRRVRMVSVDTPHASPFAQSLLFGWIATYMYEGDAPLAERRAAALALDRDLLQELLGADELRELIDADVLADLEFELQQLAEGRRARGPDEVHDLLRRLGPLTRAEVRARSTDDHLDALLADRRAIEVRVAGTDAVAATEDAALLRDALGVALPVGLPAAFTEPVERPLERLVARFARTHGPFLAAEAAERYGVPVERVLPVLHALEQDDRLVRGEFRPDGSHREWCDVDVLRRLRRRSLAALRREVEPVDATALGRFLPGWHRIGGPQRGPDALVDAIALLQGAPIPASVLENDVLPTRVRDYASADLDALAAAGEILWVGAGALGASDGRVVLLFRDEAGLLRPPPAEEAPGGPVHDAIRRQLATSGASFWPELVAAAARSATGSGDDRPVDRADETVVLAALWDLVWSGEVTNDTFAALRAFLLGRPRRASTRGRPRPGRLTRLGPPAAAGRWSLVSSVVGDRAATEVAHARARQLLERHGIVTREGVLAEGVPGGFAGVYPVLKAMEEAGQVRRGYFVAGLGAAQFAVAGAVDRLRASRDTTDDGAASTVVLAATDPAQPYGAALPWPESEGGRAARQAGAYVVLVDGALVAYLERGARSLVTFAGDDRWVEDLAGLVRRGALRRIELQRIDGGDPMASPLAQRLLDVGFVGTHRGLALR